MHVHSCMTVQDKDSEKLNVEDKGVRWRPSIGIVGLAEYTVTKLRTRLPATKVLLSTSGAAAAHVALSRAKKRQTAYYNRGTNERTMLPVGQTVRVRYDDSVDWRRRSEVQLPGQTAKFKLPSFRGR